MYQQTVALAIDTQTEELVPASRLLALHEEEFATLRRETMHQRLERQNGHEAARFRCAICKTPLWLSRYVQEGGNRWFTHDQASPECPWHEGRKYSPEQQRALLYRGQQEGREHRTLKEFIAHWLHIDPAITDVQTEPVTYGAVLRGEWKRPDVMCGRGSAQIVFEIQLSYTFLSEVIKRDEFYRREGIFIIWVFRSADLSRSTVADEAFFNRRNLFVLDDEAMRATTLAGRLTFSGYFQEPRLVNGGIADEWTMRPVTLDNVQYPIPSYRPFFFDYEAARRYLEAAQARVALEGSQRELRRLADAYVRAATAYCENDYNPEFKAHVLNASSELEACALWHRGYEPLSDVRFFGWHGPLAVILSMKLNRPVGYAVSTPYQVLEAGLRQRAPDARERFGLAVVYLWAYRIFKPSVTEKQRIWIRNVAEQVKRSIDAGEPQYQRSTAYDEAIALLFPELEEKLATAWGVSPRR